MKKNPETFLTTGIALLWLTMVLCSAGCDPDSELSTADSDVDGDSDGDSDTDTDGDSDTDTDADTDTDTDTDSAADSSTEPYQWPAIVVTNDQPFKIWQDGYVTTYPWHGYVWTSIDGSGSSISPDVFAGKTPGAPLWVSGTVSPGAANGVSIGMNILQEPQSDLISATAPNGDGVLVSINNIGVSALSLELRGANAATDVNSRWCAPITTFGGQAIPWTAFTSGCGLPGATGAAYTKQPITTVMVRVSGSNATTFNFNITNLAPIDDGKTDGILLYDSGTLTSTQAKGVQRNSSYYSVQSNVWSCSGGSQTIAYVGNTFKVTAQTCNVGSAGAPASYPSSFIGNNNNRNPAGDNLPIAVSAITSINTSWTWATNGACCDYNAAYDVWFSSGAGTANETGAPSGGYLMVWLYDPPNRVPRGTQQWSNVTVAGVTGTWNVWTDGDCISYVRTSTTNSMTFDLNNFIKAALTSHSGTITNSMYLTNVFAGFEIWSGGVGLETTDFHVEVK